MTLNPFALRREVEALQARVQTLEFAIREANDWLLVGEGIDLLYMWPENTAPSFRAEIGRLIEENFRTAAQKDTE